MRPSAVLFLLVFAGCHPSPSVGSFTPYRPVAAEKATDAALLVQDADKRALAKAGARYVGELQLDDSARAATEAAKVGATHFVVVGGSLALFRVEEGRWNDLPEQLRPTPTGGEPVSTTMITSAPLR